MSENSKKWEIEQKKYWSTAIGRPFKRIAGKYASCSSVVVQMDLDGSLCRGVGRKASCPASLKFRGLSRGPRFLGTLPGLGQSSWSG